ncbi:hypothetical protein EVAR_69683_1 [Eumeta japonica]|uniref:Uncharacterized protein n=1 Tax=Eumeta variegata TaxID=151549 RepID=A0A4C1SSX8_EUMVA|nr:hypothetical protein EVAR_69683_1 [Eumeta japonica]
MVSVPPIKRAGRPRGGARAEGDSIVNFVRFAAPIVPQFWSQNVNKGRCYRTPKPRPEDGERRNRVRTLIDFGLYSYWSMIDFGEFASHA